MYKSMNSFLPFCHNARVWQTDGQMDRILIARPRLHPCRSASMQRGNKRSLWAFIYINGKPLVVLIWPVSISIQYFYYVHVS